MKRQVNLGYWIILAALALPTAGPALASEKAAPAAAAQKPEDESGDIRGHVVGSYLSGQFARANGDYVGALQHLRKVHESNPGNTEIATELQGILLLQGQADEAIKLAEGIHKGDPKDALSSLMLALREIKHKNPEQASKFLSSAFDTSAGQLWLPLISAWVDIERHQYKKPLTVEMLGGDLGNAVPLVNYHLALINAHAGYKDIAIQNFKAAVDDPATAPPRIMQVMTQYYRTNGKPEALAPLVKGYADAHPEQAEAIDTAPVDSVQSGVGEVLYTMGGIMLGAGLSNDSVIYLQLALYVRPDFPEMQIALGDAYSDMQNFARANETYSRIAAGSRLYNRAQMHIAINYDRMNKTAEAMALLDKLAAHSARPSDALVTKGDLLRIHARYPEAVTAYTAAIKSLPKLQPDDWAVLFARGSSYERQGKWDLAEKDLLRALELKPDQPDVLNYLGYGWLERGEHLTEARQMLEKAVKARPNDAQIVDSMGWALFKLKDYAAATNYLEHAVDLLPGDPTVNDHLGDAYWRLGRKTEARFQWERSLTFSPETALADTLRRKLKEGLPGGSAKTAAATASSAGAPANATP